MIVTMLADQKRLHLQHGPIDLIVEAFGSQSEIEKAYRFASGRFETILEELVAELPLLRTPIAKLSALLSSSFPQPPPSFPRRRESRATMHALYNSALDSRLRGNDGSSGNENAAIPTGSVAQKMYAAVAPHSTEFITPMAAVAGAVADEILYLMTSTANLSKAYVNNGGDIALFLQPKETFDIGIVSNPQTGAMASTAKICAAKNIAGIATSGRHGRSHSLGIADSVTVFAKNAAIADAAATIIANHVNLKNCDKITRQPANDLSPDSDLCDMLVTTKVDHLTRSEVETALLAGQRKASELKCAGVIETAFLCLQGSVKIVDQPTQNAPLFQLPIPERSSAHA